MKIRSSFVSNSSSSSFIFLKPSEENFTYKDAEKIVYDILNGELCYDNYHDIRKTSEYQKMMLFVDKYRAKLGKGFVIDGVNIQNHEAEYLLEFMKDNLNLDGIYVFTG